MKLINVNKIYHNKNGDVVALSNINLSFESKGMIFIVGESGSGKTTLANIMNEQDHDYSGEFCLDGIIEYIEQDVCLFDHLSIIDNLKLIDHDIEKIESLLNKLDLTEHKYKKINQLSQGQKKRVQVIRSLLVPFDYLLLDEPTAGLDNHSSLIVMQILKEISKDKCVLIITHEQVLEKEYSDRTIFVNKGKIEKDICYNVVSELKQMEVNNRENKFNKNKLLILLKNMKSSLMTYSIKCMILFILVFAFMILGSFGYSINNEVTKKAKWLNSENIIVTQPLDSETKNGDLYDWDDVQKVKDNIEGIIGYQVGWEAKHISFDDTFTPDMTYGQVLDAVKKIEDEYQASEIPSDSEYYRYLDIIKDAKDYEEKTGKSFDNDRIVTIDFRAYEGFSRTDEGDIIFPPFFFKYFRIVFRKSNDLSSF